MWMIETEDQKKARENEARRFGERLMKDTRDKSEKVKDFIEANTCPHCGQCPPLPPWLH